MEGQPPPPPPGAVRPPTSEAMRPPEAPHAPEVRNITIADRVRFNHWSGDQTQTEEAFVGRTPEDIARTAPKSVQRFKLSKVVEATAVVDGQEVKMTSGPFGESGTYYVDASLTSYSRAQVESLFPELLGEVSQDATEIKVVIPKGGGSEIFHEGDAIVSSISPQEQSNTP